MGLIQSFGRLLWWVVATAVEVVFAPQITERVSTFGDLISLKWW